MQWAPARTFLTKHGIIRINIADAVSERNFQKALVTERVPCLKHYFSGTMAHIFLLSCAITIPCLNFIYAKL